MNILPFVLTLLLILSVITVEKLEKFKNREIVQTEYQSFMEEQERNALNLRQEKLTKEPISTVKQLPFDYFLTKSLREGEPEKFKQIRQITIDLINILYGHAGFFKEIEINRPNLAEEILDHLILAVDRLPKDEKIKFSNDINRLNLEDPELQKAYYHILKGTNDRENLKMFKSRNAEKEYVSLLNFIKFQRPKKTIELNKAPKELLQAIFGNDELVDAILIKRKELAKAKDPDSRQFEDEFKGKQKNGISDNILDFKIASMKDNEKYD